MTRIVPARLLAVLGCLLASLAWSVPGEGRIAAAGGRPPNVVIILADDAGFADFGFQGRTRFLTPNIDTLAREGTIYDAAYATMPFCSPSRAGLLTGRYTQRFGYEFNLTQDAPVGVDPRTMGLAVEEKTIGDLFHAAGYRTIAIGKWHLGDQAQFHPNVRGFDEFYGFLGGSTTYFPEDINPGVMERNGVAQTPSLYLTDDFAREAVAQIGANRERPFLLYLAFNAVHTPMDALGVDEARFHDIADPQRRRLAAMTWALDRAVGRVAAALKRYGLDRETLVVFTNDNGGDRIGLDASNAPLRGTKGTLLEGGIRVPMVVRYPGGRNGGKHVGRPVSLMDVLPTALQASGIAVPTNLDGRSLLADPVPARTLFWRYDVMAAAREGNWKLLRFPDRPPQLYNLAKDVGEADDLAAREPDRVRSMLRDIFAWEAGVAHPRWHTGTFWSQEDVRRYSEAHVQAENAAERAKLVQHPAH